MTGVIDDIRLALSIFLPQLGQPSDSRHSTVSFEFLNDINVHDEDILQLFGSLLLPVRCPEHVNKYIMQT